MRHAGTQTIETPRLLLRRLTPADAPAMYRNWANDPAVTRFLRWEPHKDENETFALLAAWEELYQNPDYYQWCMVDKATGEVFGSMSFYDDIAGEPGEAAGWQARGFDISQGVWEPGYCIGRAWWGQGLMTEALQAAGQRLHHRGAERRGGLLVHPDGQHMAGLLPRGGKSRQRPGDAEGRLCLRPR